MCSVARCGISSLQVMAACMKSVNIISILFNVDDLGDVCPLSQINVS